MISTDRSYSSGQLSPYEHESDDTGFGCNLSNDKLPKSLLCSTIPDLLGELGELQSISGTTRSWRWVIDQIKSYPREFARQAETVFIHKDTYISKAPRTIQAAFGVCAAYACMSEANKYMLFQTLDAEVLELLQPAPAITLSEDLSKMQAMVLYQIIRLFYGGMKERLLAEQQANLLKAWGLQLIQRINTELPNSPSTWETWILAESSRRAVLMTFMTYGVYSLINHGVCLERSTLGILPVYTRMDFWNSPALYEEHHRHAKTMKYIEYSDYWLAYPPRALEPFEKLLVVACKGLDQVEARSPPS
ncbi:hypothetical protein AN9352.2 [Paecilomyces variotii No. 5]|uniref:C6 finger domain protein n=1 Tax=Byssochlamys spectabilis (strain No. 5 / NBRC 109023) TaxID=1356009 RepID=V5I3A4_BYSSN|nr:hypothetical protein AN9352.2 [Paecilomyces variotii No. 5]